jgi:hypothetical protein
VNGSGHITQPVGARLLLLTGNAARLGFRGFGRLSDVRFRLSANDERSSAILPGAMDLRASSTFLALFSSWNSMMPRLCFFAVLRLKFDEWKISAQQGLARSMMHV